MFGDGPPRNKLRAYVEDVHRVVVDTLLVDHLLEDVNGALSIHRPESIEKVSGYVSLLDETVGQASFELIAYRKAQVDKIESKIVEGGWYFLRGLQMRVCSREFFLQHFGEGRWWL